MKKILKTAFKILIPVILLLPILTYVGIMIANNCIADSVKKQLAAYPLPQDTQLIDSVSMAEKLTGNGNGMQYLGAILVKSDLTKEELLQYYTDALGNITVYEQTTNTIDSMKRTIVFKALPDDGAYYSVLLWGNEDFDGWVDELLDFDIRGH